jgi:hypothetical protein
MIKRIIQLVLVTVFISTVAFAQKPTAGKWSTEVIFNPFPPAIALNNINGGIKFRKFLKEKTALRLGLNVGGGTLIEKFTNPLNDKEEGERKNSGYSIVFLPGLEFHLAGTEKLSPYFGFDLGAGYNTSTEKLTDIDESGRYRKDYGRERTNNSLNYTLNLVVGADYYIAQNVFLGAEFGLRTSMLQVLDSKTTYSGSAVTPYNPPRSIENTNINLNTLSVSGFRLGILF